MSIKADLEYALFESWKIELTCVDPDGNAMNLEGGGVQFRMGTDAGIALDIGLPANDPGFSAGKAILVIGPADQTAFGAGLYRYECRAYLSTGVVFEQTFGSLYVRPSLYGQFPYTGPAPTPENDLDLTSGNSTLTAIT